MGLHALLVSTYEMGRQPFGVASAAAWLRRDAWDVSAVDLSRQPGALRHARPADLVAFHLPMHTATRLAGPAIAAIRRAQPAALIVAFGLYAPLNGSWLRSLGVDEVVGGEFEEELARIASRLSGAGTTDAAVDAERSATATRHATLPRIHFLVPDRSTLPPLGRYATLQLPDGTRRTVGYTEATRGCKHLCRHCPIVPIYEGQFRVVQPDVVAADIDAQVAAGAQHITFGDPDFLNGPSHAMRVVRALHLAHPTVSYDVTIKIEHLLKHRDLLPVLATTGCLFVTSAVESIDDVVLEKIAKGHTRADFVEAVTLCRQTGVTLVPTFVAFHPWLTLDSYCELLDTIERLDLVDHVAPVQLAIRLLIPEGSRLLALDDVRGVIRGFDAATLTHRWEHPDPRVDALHAAISQLVGVNLTADRHRLFDEVAATAFAAAGRSRPTRRASTHAHRDRTTVPYLNEPWYC